jgi:hypothetical protein
MTFSKLSILLCAGAALTLGACNKPPVVAKEAQADADTKPAAASTDDPVTSAESAAPGSIARDATVIQADASGAIKTLRQGTNGWTCMPDNPASPGHDPMCMDANGLKWAQAWMAHKPPPANSVGLMYMLQGGSDASNTDPWGEKPANGKWVETGPHVMVVGAQSLNALYPTSATPDTTKPYVMFSGTPYAHLMVPVK